jgi:putative tryptophan/tyrosine transport system substrate-binding protein
VVNGLRAGLKGLGLQEGKQLALEIRDTKGDLKAVEEVAKSLEREEVNLLYTINTSVTIATRRATANVPIVFYAGTDPVAVGLVDSFAKPGGRLTGVYSPQTETITKRLEVLKEMLPKLYRVLTFYNPGNPVAREFARQGRDATQQLGVQFIERHVNSVEELQAAARMLKAGEADAFLMASDAMVLSQAQLIIDMGRAKRLPTMFFEESDVTKGALASYGSSYYEAGRLSARYIQRILSGSNAKDLPVEGAHKLELVLNLRTARDIGLTIPPNVLARADKVIK